MLKLSNELFNKHILFSKNMHASCHSYAVESVSEFKIKHRGFHGHNSFDHLRFYEKENRS